MLIPEKILIRDFKIIKGQIESPFEFDESQVESHNFQVGFDIGFDLENKMAKTDFKVEISTDSEGKNESKASGLFHFVFIFGVDNLEKLVSRESDGAGVEKMNVNADLGNALSSITYSTSRGVLLTRFQGTALRNFILPVMNPNELLVK